MVQRKKNSFFSLFFFWLTLFFCAKGFVLADDVVVSATIPDTQPPSVPILIEPADGALITDATPSFKWYESVDNSGLDHYIFYLDNVAAYGQIPLVDAEKSNYLLDYDEINGIYTLTPKNNLSDAVHTWRVVAVDYVNLRASSDVWDFRIDTLAPSFVLLKIGDTAVNISAANANSVPKNPIVIFKNDATANEPILIANGEANSSVRLTVTIPDDPTQTFTTNIDNNGYYELQLGILPRDKDIRLDFVITDAVSHVSILEGVYFRIKTQYWPGVTATPTPTPKPTASLTPTLIPTLIPTATPLPSSAPTVVLSLSPSATPTPTISMGPSLTPTPTPTVTPSTGIVPIIPPREIIHEFSSETIELLPESAANPIRAFLLSRLWKDLSLAFALLSLLVFYFVAFIVLLSKFMQHSSWLLVKKILILLIPPFFKADKNLVFEYRETLASPLVKVELLDSNGNVLDLAVTNLNGNFNDLNYPSAGQWRLQIKDSNFYYPIGDEKPPQLEFWQFYQNQMMDRSQSKQPILIPTLRAAGQLKLPFFERFRIFVLYLLDYPVWFLSISLLFALIFTLRYVSIFNVIVLGFYVFIGLYKVLLFAKNKTKLTLTAQLHNQQFSENLVLALFESASKTGRSLIMPFAYSQSKVIKHSFKSIAITAFAKKIAMVANGAVVNNQVINLQKQEEEIILQIKKV